MFSHGLLVIKQPSTTFQKKKKKKGSHSFINNIKTSLPIDMLRYTIMFQVYKYSGTAIYLQSTILA